MNRRYAKPKLNHLSALADAAIGNKDARALVELLDQHGELALCQSHVDRVRTWLASMAVGVIADSPQLCLLDAWCHLLIGNRSRSQHALMWLDQWLAENSQSQVFSMRLHISSGAIKALIATFDGNHTQAAQLAEAVLKDVPESSHWVRSALLFAVAIGRILSGDLSGAMRYAKQSESHGLRGDNLYFTVLAMCSQSRIHRHQGALWQAEQLVNSARELCQRDATQDAPVHAYVLMEQARIDLERFAVERVQVGLSQALTQLEPLRDVEAEVTAWTFAARLNQLSGDLPSAQSAVERAAQIAKAGNYVDNWYELRCAHASLALAKGDRQACLNALPAIDYEFSSVRGNEFIAALIYGAVLIADEQFDKVLLFVEPWLAFATEQSVHAMFRDFALIKVTALKALGHRTEATQLLNQCVEAAVPEGVIRPFVLHKTTVSHLLPGLSEAAQHYLSPWIDTPMTDENSSHLKTLTSRELQVLQLVAAGESNQRIADSLCVSISTVKTHVHRVLRKLDVKNRTGAVQKARELGQM